MEQVIGEIHRILRPGSHMALYVCDSFVKAKGFIPIGFELFAILRKYLEPVDIIAVVRHNKTLDMGNYRAAAEEGNFFLRGFNYLFVMRKAPREQRSPHIQPAFRPITDARAWAISVERRMPFSFASRLTDASKSRSRQTLIFSAPLPIRGRPRRRRNCRLRRARRYSWAVPCPR